MTLTGNIRKYWTLRKTGKQEPSRMQYTQKKTSITLMDHPSNYQIFGNQYHEKAKQRKNLQNYNIVKLGPQRSATKYSSIQSRNQSQPIRNDLKIFRFSANTNTTHLLTLKRLRKYLEDNGFFSKYQSGFRKSKSTNDHLFRLSQTTMKSFNQGEYVIAAFLDVEKAFSGIKFISLICPPSYVGSPLSF